MVTFLLTLKNHPHLSLLVIKDTTGIKEGRRSKYLENFPTAKPGKWQESPEGKAFLDKSPSDALQGELFTPC